MADIGSLISLTPNGLNVVERSEIRNAIIDWYKEVYGQDIELSSGTADRAFIDGLTLCLDSTLQVVSQLYSNLDINTARGRYLDNLCALTGIYRKHATASTASLYVVNMGSATGTLHNFKFLDSNGYTWTSVEDFSLPYGQGATVNVTCDTLGAIAAPAQSIIRTVTAQNFSINQFYPAILGQDEETDDELRARRLGLMDVSMAPLQNTISKLLSIFGIEDVKIYNNNSFTSVTPIDGTVVPNGAIYVLIRRNQNIPVDNALIAQAFYDSLPPATYMVSPDTTSPDIYGTAKSYVFLANIDNVVLAELACHWKECTPYTTSLSFTITGNSYFTSTEISVLGKALIKYLNSLPIGTAITDYDFEKVLYNADPLYRGRATFTVKTLPSMTQVDTYYQYNTIGTPTQSGNDWTFTIS